MAAHDVHLARLPADHRDHVLDRVLVGAVRARPAREAAEGAREHADVGRRDVAVDDEVDAVPLALALDVVGHPSDAQEVLGVEQGEAGRAVEPLARANLIPDRLEPRVAEAHVVLPVQWGTAWTVGLRPTGRFEC